MLQAMLIVLAVCMDSFAIGLAYGMKNIKISKISLMAINMVTVLFLGLAIELGDFAKCYLDHHIASIISCMILIGLGCYFILDGYVEGFIYKKKIHPSTKMLEINISKFKIVIDIATDYTKGDQDVSGDIDLKEALYIGVALSLDSIGVGFGSAIGDVNALKVISLVFIFNLVAILTGMYMGKKMNIKEKTSKTFWLSGGILIILGISKIT